MKAKPTIARMIVALFAAIMFVTPAHGVSIGQPDVNIQQIKSIRQTNEQDPALTQTVEDGESLARKGTPTEVSAGHMDLGPKLIDGTWRFLVRDDTGTAPVWRELDDVVFRVADTAKQALPDDDAYSFIEAGDTVWVIPQTEIADVVWLGWNTQDPNVVENVNGTVQLVFGGHQGPGAAHLFVQSGNFAGPTRLWDSTGETSQPVNVELNTHTHANWVFTEPGVHLVRLTVQAQLKDGTTVSDTQTLRFAVGDETSGDEARNAQWQTPTEAPDEAADVDAPSTSVNESESALSTTVALVAIAAALLVGVIVLVAVRKNSRAKQRAASALATNGVTDVDHEGRDNE